MPAASRTCTAYLVWLDVLPPQPCNRELRSVTGEGMKESTLAISRRGIYRLALTAAFLLAGIGVSPIGTSASGGGVVDGGNLYIGATAVVNAGPLNLRSGAGTGYGVVEVLSEGAYVEVLDGPYSANGYKWWEVYVDGSKNTGFVAGVFLTVVSSGPFSIGDTVYVTSDSLNVRSGPGTGYSVIDVITYGTNGLIIDGPVTANGYVWYEIEYVGGAYAGWVASDFLALVSTGGFAIGDILMVTSDTLNVRSGAGTGYSVIDTLVYGNQVVVLDGPYVADGYTWYEVSYSFGGYTGWVAGEYLAYVSSGGISIGDTVYVTSDSLNVRSGPGTSYAIESTLSYGTEGYVIDGPVTANGYTWYQIEYLGGYVGWAAGEYLAV
jgi:N-acetylmuramoyl-L-alanine amidase